jgi:hypothetical protein
MLREARSRLQIGRRVPRLPILAEGEGEQEMPEIVLMTRCGCRRTLHVEQNRSTIEVPLKSQTLSPDAFAPAIATGPETRVFRRQGNDQILALPLYTEE